MEIFKDIIFTLFGLSLFINAVLFIPQAVKIYKTKQTIGFSKLMFVGFCTSQIISAIYGYLRSDWILMVGFLLLFSTCSVVTTLIFIYSKPSK